MTIKSENPLLRYASG